MSLLRLLTAVTGILLAPLVLLAELTGACLRAPTLVETLSVGLIDLDFCSYAHLRALPIPLAALALAHAVVSFKSLIDSIPREERLVRFVLESFYLIVVAVGSCTLALLVVIGLGV